MYKDLKLGTKLIGSFIIMAAIVAITGAYGIQSIGKVSREINAIMKTRAAQQKLVFSMEVTQKACRVNLVEAALVRNNKEEFDDYVDTYRKKRDLFKGFVNSLLNGDQKLGLAPADKKGSIANQAQSVLSSWADFEEVADKLIARKTELLKGLVPGVLDQAAKNALADDSLNRMARTDIMEASENAKLDIDDLADTVETQMIQADKEAAKIKRTAVTAFISVIVVAVLVAIFLGGLATRNIMRRVDKMVKALHNGADGDLTVRVEVDSGDELGRLSDDFNAMTTKLEEMVCKVNRSISGLIQISGNILKASRQVVSAAEMQSEGVEQTSSAVIEISASVREVGDSVENLSVSSAETSASILEMAASVEEVAMNAESLMQMVEEVSSSINEMAASIKHIGSGVISLMDAATSTASSVAEMDTSIKQVERISQDTVAISAEVRKDAEIGKKAVENTIAGIMEIRRSSKITSEVIETLSERAGDIGTILSVIDEVAEQTNLLALNAAIIAAQAGEHGKGFAVVADEIKELADRTTVSTREIATVITGFQDETRRAVAAINKAEERIAEGEQLSQKSGDALMKIVAGAEKSSSQLDAIARATEEQAQGSHSIRVAMDRVAEMVAQIAAATKEQGKGSELITGAVVRMQELTAQVRSSTREQSTAGNFIARSSEDATGMIRHIRSACDEQTRGSEQILKAVENIHRSADINVAAARVMDDSMADLSRQIGTLQKEMENFKVAG
jgi:methyl-accepting chemotaxis protein